MSAEVREAEKRGYQRGYAAGRRRLGKDKWEQQRHRRESAFWQRAFLAALPWAMECQGWSFGDTPIRSTEQRVELAQRVADRALAKAKHRL